MATTSILISRFPIMLTFHPLPSSRSDTFSSYLRRSFPHDYSIILLLDYPESIRLRHLQDLRSINIAFVSLPQKVNMRDTLNFSHFDTYAFYMIKEMKNSVIYTQSARPLFAPCLFYLKTISRFPIFIEGADISCESNVYRFGNDKALNNTIKVERKRSVNSLFFFSSLLNLFNSATY